MRSQEVWVIPLREWSVWNGESECVPLCVFQSRAPADLYLMTKNPEDSPNVQDVLEIEFKKGLWARHMCHLLIPPSVCICLLPVFAVLCKSFKPPIVSFCFYSVSFLKVFSNRSPGFFFFKALSKFFFDCFFTHFQLRPCICPFSEHRFLLSQWSVSHSSLKKTPVLSTITDSLAKKLF